CGVEGFCDVLQVDAVLAAIDHRNAPAPGLCRCRYRPLRERQDLFAERVEIDLLGIVMDQQRTIGRHGLADARNRLGGHGTVERQHPPVGGIVDVAAEFHRDGAVATRQKAGRGKRRGHGLGTVSQLWLLVLNMISSENRYPPFRSMLSGWPPALAWFGPG